MREIDVTDEALIGAGPTVVYQAILDELTGKTHWSPYVEMKPRGEIPANQVGGMVDITVHRLGTPKFTSKTIEVIENKKVRFEYIEGDNGAARCEFVYHDANIMIPNYLLIQYRRAISPGAKAVKPWDYHVEHLFSTMEKVVVDELGQVGQEAIQAGLAEFAKRYGEQAMQRVVTGRSKDYESVSEE